MKLFIKCEYKYIQSNKSYRILCTILPHFSTCKQFIVDILNVGKICTYRYVCVFIVSKSHFFFLPFTKYLLGYEENPHT